MRVGGREVEISSPDKVLFPDAGITKAQLVAYHERIAPLMVPHLADRFLVLHRYPAGIATRGFMQKHAPDGLPDWIRTATAPRRSGGSVDHVVGDDAATLVHLVAMNTVTFHTWLTRVDRPDRPDQLIFDLDPPGDRPAEVAWTALALRTLLDELDLPSFPKLSGSKGVHVHVPIRRTLTSDEAGEVTRRIAGVLAARHPDRLTTEFRKEQRRGRLFLDTLRNGYGQHAAAPYTVRALPSGPIAAPLDWSEVDRSLDPRRYTVGNIFRRVGQKDDPWAGLAGGAVTIDRRRRERLDELEAEAVPGRRTA